MTNDEKARIVSDEFKFRLHVVEKLAVIETGQFNQADQISDLEACVFGKDGKGGLRADSIEAKGNITQLQERIGKRETGRTIVQALLALGMGIAAAFGFSKP